MKISYKSCGECGVTVGGNSSYKILEDISDWDKRFLFAKDFYLCELCLSDFILDTERYISTNPLFRFNFSKSI